MKIFQTIMVITFWSFTVFEYRFDSLQVKQDLTSNFKKIVSALLHKLPTNIRFRIFVLIAWEYNLVPGMYFRNESRQ